MEWLHVDCGTKFTTTLDCIIKSKYASCRVCSSNALRKNMDHCHKLAEEKDLECLSEEYINSGTHMKWRHKICGYKWTTSLNCIRSSKTKSGCPKCNGKFKQTLDDCKKTAKEKGLECLSVKYKNRDTKVLWKCKKCNLEWQAPHYSIKNDISRCYNCNTKFRSELLCKKLTEEIFNISFKKSKPAFLEGMELDGYNEEAKIGFEYQGEYHYNYNKFYHRNDPENLKKRKDDDQKKRDLCKANNVTLLEIPYIYNYQDVDSMREYIKKLKSEL